MNYIIYKAENIQNGYVYVGITAKSIEERKKDHENKANNGQGHKFQEAISTYGAEAFSWEQIDTAYNLDECAQKEKHYIVEYDSKQNGYNVDSGGGFKKTVYQYSLEDGSLVGTYDSLEKAGGVVNASKKQISRACLSVNNTFSGYYWSYDYTESFLPQRDKRKKRVIMIDTLDNIEFEYSSIAEASEITGINKSSIAKVCRGERKTAGGFKWSYQ